MMMMTMATTTMMMMMTTTTLMMTCEGELVYEAWISAGSELLANGASQPIELEHKNSLSGLKKLKERLSHSPMLTRY